MFHTRPTQLRIASSGVRAFFRGHAVASMLLASTLLLTSIHGSISAEMAKMAILPAETRAPQAATKRGEFGGDLAWLRSKYSTTPGSAARNHFIDIWEDETLSTILTLNGLTTNRTLFVNSHGMRLTQGRFAFYPHNALLPKNSKVPYYSVADLAAVVGRAEAAQIHNVVLAACNAEGVLDVAEVRKHFPNVTNITHCAAGELGYQSMFLQAIVNHSSTITPLYESAERSAGGQLHYVTARVPAANAKRFAPYIAELFRPGESKPFRVQLAGRELLELPRPATVATK